MDKSNLLIIVTVISLFIAFFLAFFLLTVKNRNKPSNSLFAFYLILIAIDVSEPIVSLIIDRPSNLGMFRSTFAFLQIPVFYLYVMSVCYSDFRLKSKHLLHFLPFLIVNIILIPDFYSVDLISKFDFIKNRQSMIEFQFIHILIHIQLTAYLIAIFLILRRTKKLYLENFAGTNIHSYHWLFQFTVVLTILYSVALLKNIFKFSDYPEISEWIKIFGLVLQMFIVCWYLYKALNNPHLFRNIDSKLKLVSDIISEQKTTELSFINEQEHNEDLQKLKKYMSDEKPFLDPSITIQNISENINIPVRELSVLINHQLGKHFYDFVNTYRIEYAMEILKNPAKTKVTVLEILYEVGFNSKSSFNTAFKKHTGNTPTSYRKTLHNSIL
ncbi:helix-turn-helix domain-containing protein [Chryseobacterium luquanense]|uniref:AraC family transcriptional regulator n=1 Tax=Chryseobacterium luquanense TaxID=2983766 RepID=A0ABT3XZV6_9FLAO|nr:AraC family transcriptional regulator [Chryseobacterium luquanense]MCX8531433.1 AraC family transcriptional regulator [Chryseobacterium luquanense]